MATGSVGFKATLNGVNNYFIAALYDTSALGVVVEFIAPSGGGGSGYPATFQVTFATVLNASKLYRVILWENTTAVVGGTSRVSADFKASTNQISFRADLVYTYAGVGGVFTSNTTIVDASLIGYNISYEQFGSGTLTQGVDYSYNSATGTIILLAAGVTYQSGQKMVVHFQPQVSASAPVYSGISAGSIVAISTVLTNSSANQAIYCQGSGGSFIITLPGLSTMTDYQPIEFYSAGGNHINVKLLCGGADNIQWNVLRTNIILGQAEQITLYKANGVWNVKNPSPNIKMVGEILYRYSNVEFPNLLANGTIISRVTYSRLWDYVSGLPASAVVAEAIWTNTSVANGITYFINKGKFSSGDGSTTFRIPVLYGVGFLKAVDGVLRLAGSLETEQVGAFSSNIGINIGDSFLGTGGGWLGAAGRGQNNTANQNYPQSLNAGLENLPSNVAVYALIRT